jgi:hypothetical protein
MSQSILGLQDLSLEKVKLDYHSIETSGELPTNSLVGIVDNERQTRLEISLGLYDEDIARIIKKTYTAAQTKFVRPEKEQFFLICELILRLKSPNCYLKEKPGDEEGYLLKKESIDKVVTSAKNGSFTYLFLQNVSKHGDSDDVVYTGMDIVFSKIDVNAKVTKG